MSQPKVSIIDYDIGNLFSVFKACEYAGMNCSITNNVDEIMASAAIILPGVGAFGDAMENLQSFDLVDPLKDFANSGKPLMGICLGMQLLLSESEELGKNRGLGIIDGICKKFPTIIDGNKIKVPQITWNKIYSDDKNFKKNTPLEEIKNNEYMYFVHSYYADLNNKDEILSKTNYEGIEYCSSINKNNIFGFQFHPEKSGLQGLKIYKKYNEIINNKFYKK